MKTGKYINATGYKTQKEIHSPMVNKSMTKQVRIYNREKTVPPISGAGKT